MPLEIDGRGLSCAMLTAKVWREWRNARVGDEVNIITTNEGSEKDIPAQLRSLGSELVKKEVFERASVVNGRKYNKEYHYHARRLR